MARHIFLEFEVCKKLRGWKGTNNLLYVILRKKCIALGPGAMITWVEYFRPEGDSEIEQILLDEATGYHLVGYVESVLKRPWPEAEERILFSSPSKIYDYCIEAYVQNNRRAPRDLELEIETVPFYWRAYLGQLKEHGVVYA